MSYMLDEEREERGQEKSDKGGKVIIGVLAIAFLPVLLPTLLFSTAIYQVLLRRKRFPPSTIFGISFGILAVSYILWRLFGFTSTVESAFTGGMDGFKDFVVSMIAPTLIFDFALASILAWCASLWTKWDLKRKPWLVQLEGRWTYGFSFRRTLFQWLKRERTIKELKNGDLDKNRKRSPLGIDEKTDQVVYRYTSEAVVHTMITGGTGTGKSITILSLIRSDLRAGRPVILVNFKDDPELTRKVIAWCSEFGADFYHVTGGKREDYPFKSNPNGQSYFDCLGDDYVAMREILFNMREYDKSAEVFKGAMRDVLSTITLGMSLADKEKENSLVWDKGGIAALSSVLDGDNIRDLHIACEGTEAEKSLDDLIAAINRKNSPHASQFSELKSQIRTLTSSSWGRWLKVPNNGEQVLDLAEVTKPDAKPSVVLFSMSSEREEDFASYMGSLIFQNITNLSANRRDMGFKNYVGVYADEFQSVNPKAVAGLLEKGRASSMAMTLSVQNFSQIMLAAEKQGEDIVRSMMDNCTNYIIHAGSSKESAIKLSELVGDERKTFYRATAKSDSFLFYINWFNRRNELVNTESRDVPICDHKELMALSRPRDTNGRKSTAMVINKDGSSDPRYADRDRGLARLTWMIPDEAVLKDPDGDSVTEAEVDKALAATVTKTKKEELEEQPESIEPASTVESELEDQGHKSQDENSTNSGANSSTGSSSSKDNEDTQRALISSSPVFSNRKTRISDPGNSSEYSPEYSYLNRDEDNDSDVQRTDKESESEEDFEFVGNDEEDELSSEQLKRMSMEKMIRERKAQAAQREREEGLRAKRGEKFNPTAPPELRFKDSKNYRKRQASFEAKQLFSPSGFKPEVRTETKTNPVVNQKSGKSSPRKSSSGFVLPDLDQD